MIAFLKTIIYIPLYNIFILILNISWIDAGIATVVLTILVKFLLYPLTKKSAITQLTMKAKEGEIAEIKSKYKDNQEQAVKIMEFYKINKINPFSSIFIILIQIPLIYSLYHIFFQSGLPEVDTAILYSFIKPPESVSMMFLGLLDVSQKSIFLALLASVSTYFQMHFSALGTNKNQDKSASAQSSGLIKEDFTQTMTRQMKYTMPIVVFFISWKISGVVALYWFVSNVVGLLQDIYIKRKVSPPSPLLS